MYQDVLVGDGVIHAYNNRAANCRSEAAEQVVDDIYDLSVATSPEGYELTEEQWYREFTADEVSEMLFLESDVDFGVYHALPIFDYFEDGYSALEKGIQMRKQSPERIKILGAVDPLARDSAEQMRRQWDDHDVDGFKLYPTFYRDGRARQLRLDDELLPLVEQAQSLGVEHIGVHKVLPLGPVGQHMVDVDDVAEIAGRFPDIDFEILHPDLAFLEEIKFQVGNFDNIYVNFEFSVGFAVLQPRRFAEIMGELLLYGDAEKLLFGTGVPLVHPQGTVDAFWDFEMPEDMQEEHGYPALTDDIKRKMLGENLLDLYDWDRDALEDAIENDHWREQRESQGRPDVWESIDTAAAAGD